MLSIHILTGEDKSLFMCKNCDYSQTCLKLSLIRRPTLVFKTQLSLNAGQKYCRMLQEEHSAILSTFIKLPFVIWIFFLSIFEWPLKTGFTGFFWVFFCRLLIFLKSTVSKNSFRKTFRLSRSGLTFCPA